MTDRTRPGALFLASALPLGALTVAFGAAALALGACGSSARHGSLQERQAIGRKGLIVRSDLPAGWSSTPAQISTGTKLDRLMAGCLHRSVSGGAAMVQSPAFKRGESEPEEIQNSVSVEPTAAEAEARYAFFKQKTTPGCLRASFMHLLAQQAAGVGSGGLAANGVAFGHVKVRLLTVVSESDAAVGYRVVIPVTALGRTVKAIADLVVLRIGRATTDIVYGGLRAIDPATEKRLNILVCERLRAALAAH